MIKHLKKVVKKKSFIAAFSMVAVTGTVLGIQAQKSPEPTRYVLEAVSRGSVITTVDGSGQVAGETQIDIKPQASGAVTAVLVSSGQEVEAGTPLFEIDRTDAVKAVRDAQLSVHDAELSLASAQISLDNILRETNDVDLQKAEHTLNQALRSLEVLHEGPDALEIHQAEVSLEDALRNAERADDGVTPKTVRDAYDDAVPTLASVVQTLQTALEDADSVMGIGNITLNDDFEQYLGMLKSSTLSDATISYYLSKKEIDALSDLTDAFELTGSVTDDVDTALADAVVALNNIQELMKHVEAVLKYTPPSSRLSQNSIDAFIVTMQSNRSSVTSKQTSALNQQRSIDQAWTSYEQAEASVESARLSLAKTKEGPDANDIATAEERVMEAQMALDAVKAGADDTDIASAKNTLAQRQSSLQAAKNRLADAREDLNDYTVRAPIAGIITAIDVRVAEEASASTALATLVTKAKVASITLNEVDIAKINVGQQVTMTFDALPDITIAGTVAEVDAVGTAEQGVVGFGVTIALTTDDERILPGMSVSASIMTDTRTDVLTVPNGALVSMGGGSAVRILPNISAEDAANREGVSSETEPELVSVETGLANDHVTEIVSGIDEGMSIVTRTIESSDTGTASSGLPSSGGSGGGFSGAGAMRMMVR